MNPTVGEPREESTSSDLTFEAPDGDGSSDSEPIISDEDERNFTYQSMAKRPRTDIPLKHDELGPYWSGCGYGRRSSFLSARAQLGRRSAKRRHPKTRKRTMSVDWEANNNQEERSEAESAGQIETEDDDNSDSEPIISDEEERNFTHQSMAKRPCTDIPLKHDEFGPYWSGCGSGWRSSFLSVRSQLGRLSTRTRRPKARKRTAAAGQIETESDDNSDSEPIISDEEERNFTYQSMAQRPCTDIPLKHDELGPYWSGCGSGWRSSFLSAQSQLGRRSAKRRRPKARKRTMAVDWEANNNQEERSEAESAGQIETEGDDNSDSEPIISDEDERNFTYQSMAKRPRTDIPLKHDELGLYWSGCGSGRRSSFLSAQKQLRRRSAKRRRRKARKRTKSVDREFIKCFLKFKFNTHSMVYEGHFWGHMLFTVAEAVRSTCSLSSRRRGGGGGG